MNRIVFDNPLLLAAANGPLATLLLIVGLIIVMLTVVSYLILFERWIAAQIQDRVGPNRAGPFGLLQPVADIVKLFIKEDFTPSHVDRKLYWLGPIWVIAPAIIGMAVLPIGGTVVVAGHAFRLQVASIDVAALFLLMTGSMGVYGLVVGGWASDTKYSVLGALRSASQLISYEVPAGLVVVSIVLVAGSLRLETIAAHQAGLWWGWLPHWLIFTQPLAFLIFIVCILAECNRLPFDLPEAEQELIGGFHTEYSSMKFGLFFLAEFTNAVVASLLTAVLFLGGFGFWGLAGDQPAGVQTQWYFGLARVAVSFGKAGLIILLMMQIRWTLPRFRFDQLAKLAWQVLVPASLLLVFANGIVLWLHAPPWAYLLGNVAVALLVAVGAWLLGGRVTGRQRTLVLAERSHA
ncbi:MAG: NADH-quinone oxidoreductase subunit H [Phycisphaerae bacterium]|nr:NADH-quinone oxidoreductase subunit H [Phycisphaerae bacterium]